MLLLQELSHHLCLVIYNGKTTTVLPQIFCNASGFLEVNIQATEPKQDPLHQRYIITHMEEARAYRCLLFADICFPPVEKRFIFSDKMLEDVIKRFGEIIHNLLHDPWGLKRRPMEIDVKGKYRTKIRKIIGSRKHYEINNMMASVLVSIFKFSTFWYLRK